MADGTWDHFFNAYAHVTAGHGRLSPRNAATEIDRLIPVSYTHLTLPTIYSV